MGAIGRALPLRVGREYPAFREGDGRDRRDAPALQVESGYAAICFANSRISERA